MPRNYTLEDVVAAAGPGTASPENYLLQAIDRASAMRRAKKAPGNSAEAMRLALYGPQSTRNPLPPVVAPTAAPAPLTPEQFLSTLLGGP